MNETGFRATRRVFLGGTLAVGAAGALSACGSDAPEGPPEPVGEPTQATTTGDLPVGSSASVSVQGNNYLLHRPDESTVLAYSAVCTHQGCQVGIGDGNFQCPCHGSEFSFTDGSRLAGPAEEPLPAYAAEIVGDKVMIYLES